MKVLVACEYSGRVREAFRAKGHDAWSCDLIPADDNSPNHFQEDVMNVIHWHDWDMMLAFPPCTHLASSGARWFKEKEADGRQKQGIDFFMELAEANIGKIAIENPVGIMSSKYRKPDQIIQPYWFGDKARKKTCLWLKSLPKLEPTNLVEPDIKVFPNGKTFSADYGSGNKGHGHRRSLTYLGIAKAMADQWG